MIRSHFTSLATVTLVIVASLSAGCEPSEPATTDTRSAIELPVEGRDAVIAEMRTMLGSLNGILAGTARGDTAAVRQAATASGTATAADRALERLLPEEFLRIGISTNQQFDSIAVAVAMDAGTDTLVARLARLTSNCVSCHAAYRLAAR